MTKRKTPSKQAPQASVEVVEDVKQESNTKVAQANTTAKKASTGGRRGRPKKALVEKVGDDIVYTEAGKKLLDETLTTVSKAVDVDSRTITYVGENRAILVADKPPSLYDRFVGWLTYKLYQITFPFRGY